MSRVDNRSVTGHGGLIVKKEKKLKNGTGRSHRTTPVPYYAPKQNKGTMRSTLLQTITLAAAVVATATLLLAPAEAATQEEEDAAALKMGEEMKRNFHQRFIPHRPDKPVSKRERE